MYVVNADGSDQSRLTDYPQTTLPYQGSFNPTFSPQGKVVVQSSRLYNSEILLMDAGGSDISSLTLNKTGDVDPAFSPDGSQITFATEPTVGNFDVYTMGPDGSDKTPLAKDPARDRYPAYSPDGSTIAFTSDRNGNNDIYVMGSDGSNQKRLTESPGFESNPVFTPTGDRIVFESNREIPGLYAMDPDGSNETRLTNSVGGEGDPTISPDGERIAFYVPSLEGILDVYVMNLDGSNIYAANSDGTGLTNLTDTDSANEGAPAFSADGTKMAYASIRRDRVGKLVEEI